MAEETTVGGITPEEDRLIGETPAVLSNKFYCTSNANGTKITFAEGFRVAGEHQIRSRCAVYLVPSDLRELYLLLEPIVERMKPIRVDDEVSS